MQPRAKAFVEASTSAMVVRSARHVLGEASASLMKVIATMPRAMAATRATADSKTACGVSILAMAMIATV